MPEGPGTLLEDQSEPFTSMRLTYFVVGILSILIILLVSMIYTRFQAKAILKPVKALEEGARRVEQGDLLVPVLYEGKDEFSTVCGAFNRMQDALRREQEKNRAYEKARSDMVNGISHDLQMCIRDRNYVETIEKEIGVRISMVSNGPGRDDIIMR